MTAALTPTDAPALAEAGQALENSTPLEILRWASSTFESRLTFATGFGAEGCVLLDLIGRHELAVDIFTLDTGVLFPETYELWRRLESKYGFTIRGVSPDQTIEQQAATHGPELWGREPDRCCDLRKVTPLTGQLARFDAWITAIRRDQSDNRASALAVEWDDKFALSKVNPLVHWTKRDVWAHLLKHDVPYNPLHDRGYPSVGCLPCTSTVEPGEHDRAGRWRGASKTECGLHTQVDGADKFETSSPA
jgi:phosphoadenylyl-sulfate reductase (thioredoxin)